MTSVLPDAVHVAKRKRQSFANWFIYVNGERINLVLLRELRNDDAIRDKLAEILPCSAVRNRDRQDVESILQICSDEVREVLKRHVTTITHTIMPEKYRLSDNNKKGMLQQPIGICAGTMGHLFVTDCATGNVFQVRASHYPADVTQVFSSLDCPIGTVLHDGILFVVESRKAVILYRDLTGKTVVDPSKLTVKQLREKLEQLGELQEGDKKSKKKELQEKLQDVLSKRKTGGISSQNSKQNRNYVKLDQDIQKPAAACFTDSGQLVISSFSGHINVIDLTYGLDFISGVITKKIEMPCQMLHGLCTFDNTLYASASDNTGGIYQIKWQGGLEVNKIFANETDGCNVHCIANYNNTSLVFTDTGEHQIKMLDLQTKHVKTLTGSVMGTRDGSKAQFAQPTGICTDQETIYIVDTASARVRMITGVNGLLTYLEHLNIFCDSFGLHKKKHKPSIYSLHEAIERNKTVYNFDQKCIQDVKNILKKDICTQGPEGTISSVVIEDEKRILQSLNDLQALQDKLKLKCTVKSLLTLVVENTFAEMRAGDKDMPLQLDFDYRFSRAVKERLKRQCATRFDYFTSHNSYYPQVSCNLSYHSLPKVHPPLRVNLTQKQVSEMRNWRAEHGQSVPQKTVRSMSTRDNPGTLPINLYACEPPRVKPVDLTQLMNEDALSPAGMTDDVIYSRGQVVCINWKESPAHTGKLVLAKLLNDALVGRQVKVTMYEQDAFYALQFVEQEDKTVLPENIVCVVESCQLAEDILTMEENEFALLQSKFVNTIDTLTAVETAHTDEPDTSVRRSTRVRKRRCDDNDFFYYDD